MDKRIPSKNATAVKRWKKKRQTAESAIKALGEQGFYRLGVEVAKALDAGFTSVRVEDLLLKIRTELDK